MAKAILTTKDGTEVRVDGTPEEIARLMNLYGGSPSDNEPSKPARKKGRHTTRQRSQTTRTPEREAPAVDHIAIVNSIRDADDFEAIESQILDKKSQLDRSLLPLYAMQEFMNSNTPLTTGDIAKVLTELGNRVKQQNVAKKLKGSKYVMPLAVRKEGTPTPYRINRQGTKYFKGVIARNGGSGGGS